MNLRLTLVLVGILALCQLPAHAEQAQGKRPNILFAISDDQSYPHASAYGSTTVKTPAFDRVAKMGVLFNNAFVASPGCSPCRAGILTGRHTWMIEHAGTHASSFPKKYVVFTDLLENAGYTIGYTGKPWGPGNWKVDGRTRNPVGPSFGKAKRDRSEKTAGSFSGNDYAGNFKLFVEQWRKQAKQGAKNDQPFFFWYGASEPHRGFKKDSWKAAGKKLSDAEVPPFLPDTPEVRGDILDYGVEIEWFDKHLGQMLDHLEKIGELENTIVVVTSDNGMAFPRAKANNYEYGIHMPLAISWPKRVKGGRVVDDLVQFVDFAPTFLTAANTTTPDSYVGKALQNVLFSGKGGQVDPTRTEAYSARERHSSSRWNNLAYPIRSLRTPTHLLIWNAKHERWPAGAPQKVGKGNYPKKGETALGPMHGGYHDIDACPTLSFLIAHREDPKVKRFFHLAVDHRPAFELFDITKDPGCLENLYDKPAHAELAASLKSKLMKTLKATGDPRVTGNGDIFETYKRYSGIRRFPKPDWAK